MERLERRKNVERINNIDWKLSVANTWSNRARLIGLVRFCCTWMQIGMEMIESQRLSSAVWITLFIAPANRICLRTQVHTQRENVSYETNPIMTASMATAINLTLSKHRFFALGCGAFWFRFRWKNELFFEYVTVQVTNHSVLVEKNHLKESNLLEKKSFGLIKAKKVEKTTGTSKKYQRNTKKSTETLKNERKTKKTWIQWRMKGMEREVELKLD